MYFSQNIIRSRGMKRPWHVVGMEEMRSVYQILVRNPEVKRSLEKIRCRQENNIKMDLRTDGCEGFDSTHLVRDRFKWLICLKSVKNIWLKY
jgi:hypothetical protein